MIQVMIVEDEPRILRDIKKLVERINPNFQVTQLLRNGQQAIAALENDLPDILITDIQMPLLDGLELISYIKQREMPIIPVILSGYKEFEYAKRAMILGVNHYLLKPVDEAELTLLLIDLQHMVQKRKVAQKREYYSSLVDGYSGHTDPNFSFVSDITLNNHLLLICAGSFPSRSFSNDAGKLQFWDQIHLEDIISTQLSASETIFAFNGTSTSEKVVLLGLTQPSHEKLIRIANTLFYKLKCLSYPITLIMGEALDQMSNTGEYLIQCRQYLAKNIVLGKSQILHMENANKCSYANKSIQITQLNSQLLLLLQQGQMERYKQVLSKILQSTEFASYPQIQLESILKELLLDCLKQLSLTGEYSSVELEMEINEIVSTSNSYSELSDNLLVLIDDLFSRNIANDIHQTNCSNELLVNKIEKYIELHLTDAINQQNLSDVFGLVPSYLSKLFRRFKGLSPSDYIVMLRIEKAKELFKSNPELLAKDVSHLVGYADPLYFSKIFKKETGMSTSEFKNLSR